jgi:glycosyltransferase involved in cell wall biosynthesis
MPGALDRALYRSHGYPALGLLKCEGREAAVWAFPCNRDILDRAAGLIVHSRFPQTLAERFYGDDSSDAERWALIPLLRPFRKEVSRAEARRRLGLDEQDFIVCSFGMLGPIKLNDRLLSAWLGSTLAADTRCRLVFVGHNPPGDYGRRLSLAIEAGPAASRISITGFASPEQYALWLAAADLSVQLRTRTRGETSAAILDCLSYGIPLVFNAHGAAADIPDMLGVKLSDEADEDEIRGALERLREHPSLRNRLSQAAIRYMTAHHAPAHVGTLYRDAIERFAVSHPGAREQRLLESLSNMVAPVPPTDDDLAALAACVAGNRPAPARRTLFLDVSELARRDSASGIQRVVKSLMRVMVLRPLNDIRVEPVYEREGRFHHARALTCRLLGLSALPLPDDLVEFAPGDLFLGLDFVPDRVPAMKSTFQALRARGVGVHFVVYDLLPLLRPDWHPQGTDEAFFRPWLETVAQTADSLVCISRAVADDLAAWLAQQPPARADEARIGFFHLGADISDERPAGSVPPSHQAVLEAAGRRPTFLMVGTVEPRKGYAQALAAFEQIWRDGTDANLVIVGKQGWMVEALVDRLRGNVEANRRLFWVTDAGDDVLLRLYEQSSALLAASEGEGFGLPLVEASKHALPIIARDIPPFREVAGRHAWYFSGLEADELAEALRAWLRLDEAGKAPQSADMPWLSWEQSADQLLDAVLGSVRLRVSLTADG